MLRSVKSLEKFAINATDGMIGRVKDFYFDDRAWVVRYIVVDAGAWLGTRSVLVSPYSITQPDWAGSVLPATISIQQIKNSPSIDSDKPVSRQYEKSYLGYYGYPFYWGGSGLWGGGYYPGDHANPMDSDGYSGYQGIWARRRVTKATRTFVAATQSPATTSRRATVRSVTCRVSCWMTCHGRFVT